MILNPKYHSVLCFVDFFVHFKCMDELIYINNIIQKYTEITYNLYSTGFYCGLLQAELRQC